jgi:hypothetical protein
MGKIGSKQELADILDLGVRRIEQLFQQNSEIFVRYDDGSFDLYESVKRYYENKFSTENYSLQLKKEELLHEKAKREKAELLLGKMRNQLHEGTVIQEVLTDMFVTFRSRILGIPAKISTKLVRKTSKEISRILERELKDALTELSEYDPAMFAGSEVVDTDGTENDQSVQEGT